MSITVQLPQQIQQQLQSEWTDLERHALEGLITEAFRQGKLSSIQVGQALGMDDRWEAIQFLSERGAYPGYEEEDFARDMDALAKLNARNRP